MFCFILYCIISYLCLATGSFCGHVLMHLGQTSDFFSFLPNSLSNSDSKKIFGWKVYEHYLILFYFHVKISNCYKLPVLLFPFRLKLPHLLSQTDFQKTLFSSSVYGSQFGIRWAWVVRKCISKLKLISLLQPNETARPFLIILKTLILKSTAWRWYDKGEPK